LAATDELFDFFDTLLLLIFILTRLT